MGPRCFRWSEKVGDVVKRFPSSDSKRDVVYMTCEGTVIRRREDVKNCVMCDGSTVQVMTRMRGGGKHKDKMSKKRRRSETGAKRSQNRHKGRKLSLNWSAIQTNWTTTETQRHRWLTETQ